MVKSPPGARTGAFAKSTIAEEDQAITIRIAKAELPRSPFGVVDGGVGDQDASRGELLEQRVRIVDLDPNAQAARGSLFEVIIAGNVIRHYDVTADGQRLLMIKDNPATADSSAQIIVVQNWLEELKRLVPTK